MKEKNISINEVLVIIKSHENIPEENISEENSFFEKMVIEEEKNVTKAILPNNSKINSKIIDYDNYDFNNKIFWKFIKIGH